MNMAEMMEALVPVSMGLGALTDEEYEDLVVAAMPSIKTEGAPTIEIAVEPEKPVDPIVVAEPVVEAPKPRRVCSKCGHHDGNSVGRIRRGRIIKIEKDGLRLFGIEPICAPCVEQLPPEESEKIGKIGYLISVVGLENRRVYAARDAMKYWMAFKAGEAEPLQVRRDASGRVLCGVPNCKLCYDGDGESATRFTVVKDAEGKHRIAGIGREQMAALIKAGALRSVQLFDYRGAMFEINRRDKKDADEVASLPKPAEPAPTEIVAEPEKPAPASQPVKKLSRAEREARRDARRARLAAELEHDKAEAAKRGVRYDFGDDSNRHHGGGKNKDKKKSR